MKKLLIIFAVVLAVVASAGFTQAGQEIAGDEYPGVGGTSADVEDNGDE